VTLGVGRPIVFQDADMRDLIYFDADKASSLLSQLEGGLLREVQESDTESSDDKVGLQAHFAILKADIGAGSDTKASRIETRILHHALLNRLELVLRHDALVVDLPSDCLPSDVAEAREVAISRPYVAAEGWAVIEDFERLKTLSQKINAVLELTRKSARYTLEQTEAYKSLVELIDSQKRAAEAKQDKKARAIARAEVRRHEAEAQQLFSSVGTLSPNDRLPDWLVEGIAMWVDSFNSRQIHLRIYPYGESPPFQLLANLKRSCFVDPDLDHVLFSYGKRPTVKLGVFGLVTSAPPADGHPFNAMAEFSALATDQPIPEAIGLERSFRTAFEGMDVMDRLMRFSRYPTVTLLPIAVFRSITAPASAV